MYTLVRGANKFPSGYLRVLLKLFDTMILPICTHNCERWRSNFLTRKFVASNFLGERQLENVFDKLRCVFLKRDLGVNLKVSNSTVISETNRSSPIPSIIQ